MKYLEFPWPFVSSVLRPVNLIPQWRIPGIHRRQKLSQLPVTTPLSYQANYRQEIDECRYHRASSVAIREGRGGRSSHRRVWDRRSSDERTGAGSA